MIFFAHQLIFGALWPRNWRPLSLPGPTASTPLITPEHPWCLPVMTLATTPPHRRGARELRRFLTFVPCFLGDSDVGLLVLPWLTILFAFYDLHRCSG